MKVDNSFERYHNNSNQRYEYAVSHLFGEVLDIGCGDGYGILLMQKNKNITNIFGIDIQDEAILRAKKNTKAKIIKADAENLPFEEKTFDSIHCGQTLEHIANDEQVVKEIRRVARKRAVFSVPINGGISEQHLREYTEKSIKELISKYFTIISTKLFVEKYKRLVLITEK